jgi:CheY-like chemotaxis protein
MTTHSPEATTILIVDDDQGCAEALSDTLQDIGYQVTTTNSAVDALRYLESAERPSAIILDLLMPGMTGEEFLERRQGDPGLAQIPVIVLSATETQFRSPDTRTPVLRKPVDPAVLLDVIASVIT